MADWSNLPIELLDLIAEHLETETDIIWFRSVCSTWRSSVDYNPHPMPSLLPSLPNQGISDTSSGFYLCKSTIFQLGLPQPNSQTLPARDGWLIKVEQGARQSYLLNPLSRSKFWPLPDSFPRRLNLFKFKVSELGHEYILRHVNHHPFQNTIRSAGKLYFCLKACSISGIQSSKVLTIHVSGKLQMFKFEDQKWTIMDNFPSVYDDIILFDGQFYAVNRTGRTVIVNADASPVVSLAADAVFGGDKKILVESCGELFLVDRYMSGGVRVYEQFRWYVKDRTARFKVFRLVPDEKKWVRVGNLGDRMFFVGDNRTFSTSASDFSGCKGNCIFFTDHHSGWSKQEGGDGVGVFDLETGSIGSLANYPDYSKLFWPPPNWVSSIMLEEERAERSDVMNSASLCGIL